MIKVSVIVCTYNNENHISKTLESLNKQSLSYEHYEIVIINNNSNDNTEKVCLTYINKHQTSNINYFFESKPGLSVARNRGIKESINDIISFIDDDAVADNNYIKSIIETFDKNTDIAAAGGKVIPIYPDNNEPVWMSKYLWGLVAKLDQGDISKKFTKKYPVGCNMIFRESMFSKYGTFNEDITYRGDEKFVFLKLKKGKEIIFYNPEILVYHIIPESRLTHESVIEISKSIGYSEKIRLKSESYILRILKFLEYLVKFSASLIISFKFILLSHKAKAKYLTLTMFYTIKGYIF